MSHLLFMSVADWTEKYSDTSERLFLGTTMALIGMTIVVAMLVLISLSILLLPKLFGRSKSREAQTELQPQPAARKFAPVPVNADTDEMDGQLIAVITAALSASLSTGEYAAATPVSGFRVRRIRRLR